MAYANGCGMCEVSDRNLLFRGLKVAGRFGEGTPGAEIRAQMAVKFLILDACRDTPFGRSGESSLSRGLAQMSTVEGSLIAYATSPGKTAADGEGRHSPYTAQLLRHLPTPGLLVEPLFKAQ